MQTIDVDHLCLAQVRLQREHALGLVETEGYDISELEAPQTRQVQPDHEEELSSLADALVVPHIQDIEDEEI